MNPSSALRIDTMMRTLQDTIMPAIRDDQPLAKEQAGLMLGHLAALQQQANREHAVDDYCQALLLTLADEVLRLGAEESSIADLLASLDTARKNGELIALGFHIERILASSDTSAVFKRESSKVAMQYAADHTHMGRAWFLPMGFDGNPKALPTVAELLAE
ncbi:MAG: hypothetical protein P1U47_00385 [Zhongshania sp.]|uniref:hypothetical protein n=1 Tax=Zhongshania sp. TaxID=1971902 RepID=UPI0026297CE4|nr:hypothetical protein [Zhongshania sp.]MDF1690799.1 hypothetical protein [Zhongshania sp.]